MLHLYVGYEIEICIRMLDGTHSLHWYCNSSSFCFQLPFLCHSMLPRFILKAATFLNQTSFEIFVTTVAKQFLNCQNILELHKACTLCHKKRFSGELCLFRCRQRSSWNSSIFDNYAFLLRHCQNSQWKADIISCSYFSHVVIRPVSSFFLMCRVLQELKIFRSGPCQIDLSTVHHFMLISLSMSLPSCMEALIAWT